MVRIVVAGGVFNRKNFSTVLLVMGSLGRPTDAVTGVAGQRDGKILAAGYAEDFPKSARIEIALTSGCPDRRLRR
jgi:hypothetical protein